MSALSRHLAVLRDARLVERSDVEHDARGRTYRLREHAIEPFIRWTARLASAVSDTEAAALLARTGAFLEAFSDRDVEFFERHVADEAQLVFPEMPAALGKRDVVDAAADHPRWVRHDVTDTPTVRRLAGHTLCAYPATVQREDDDGPRHVFISSLFANGTPWQLVHLQWTTIAPSRGATR